MLVAAIVAVAAVLVLRDDGDDDPSTPTTLPADLAAARAAAERFADAVTDGLPSKGGTVQPAAEVDPEYLMAVAGLGSVALEVEVGRVTRAEGGDASAALSTTWTVGGAAWTTEGDLALEETGGEWRAQWSLAALDRRLGPGDQLTATRRDASRGAILAASGEALTSTGTVVVVGVEPQRATDVAALTAELARILGVDATELTARIGGAAPDAFVEVTTLSEADYAARRAELQPLPGTVFRRTDPASGPAVPGAAALLGQVAPATEEQVAASEGRLQLGQPTGAGGLQQAYDERLSGTPGLEVTVTRGADPDPAAGTTTGSTTPAPPAPEPLETIAPVDGLPVTTTLDVATQQAAATALEGQSGITALVALRASTGELLADANGSSGGYDYGSRAQVPPGSTFKVVTTLAHLRKGLTPEQVVPCPPTLAVGGRTFKNAGNPPFSLGDVPFRLDFARSCNTAFAGLAPELASTDLTEAAQAFGIGLDWEIGPPAYTGSVPETADLVEAAAASIGQGRNAVSPLDMAGVAATVAAGRWRAPTLVTDPPRPTPEERPLAPGEAETLRELMRGVVTDGSGTALLGLPGEPVLAKTGTAEFGNQDPPETHAWIIGIQGDIAFAVFVERGESGGGVAGPLAARFLTALAGG